MATMAPADRGPVARWRIPGHDHDIEIPLGVVAAILAAAKEGFNRFPRGGLEVGGVLFGVREEGRVQVRAARPIPCKHTLGPSFTLAPEEHDELAARLLALKDDPELAGLVPVGWYHSHTRSGLLLSDADCHLHNRHFPQPWQIALVVRPEAGRPAELGIFVRRPDEELSPRPALVVNEEALPPAEDTKPAEVSPDEAAAPAPRPRWRFARWAALAAGMVLLALGAYRAAEILDPYRAPAGAYWQRVTAYWMRPAAPAAERPFALSLASAGGELIIRWNAAGGLAGGKGATLSIRDGGQRQEFPLDAEAFARGELRWERHSEQIAVTLSAVDREGRPLRESAYFTGALPAPLLQPHPPRVLPALENEKAQLEIAVRRQKLESDSLAVRLTALQAALKAQAAAPPPPPAPAKPEVTLIQKAPEPERPPVELVQRPEATPGPSPSPAPPGGTAPVTAQSGRLLWTGALTPGRLLTIQGRQASIGSFSGQLPGVPVRIAVYPAELSSAGLIVYTSNPRHSGAGLTEAPAPANAWTRTTYRYAPEKAAAVQVVQPPGEGNGWRAVWIRSSAPVEALVIDWEILR